MLATFSSRITNVLITIGTAVLSLMMFLTALDVGLRYIFNSPLPGALELVEYMMAIIIPFCIVYCEFKKNHVKVELILGRFSKKIQLVVGVLTTLISLVFVVTMTWQSILGIHEAFKSKLTSAVLLIPTYPFFAPVAVGIGAFALILFLHLLELISKGKSDE